MPKPSNHIEITLSMSASQAQQTLKALQASADDLRQRLDAAAKAGDKVSAKKLSAELTRVNSLMRRMQTETANAEQVLRNLDKATPKELRKTLSTLQRQIQGVSRESPRFQELAAQIRRVRDAIQETNETMKPQPGLWERIKSAGTGAVAAIQAGLATITGAADKAREYVEAYAGMQEEMAGVSKYSGLSADEVERLNEEFKKMDTRSSREQLNQAAQDAGRLGKQSVEDILGFVRASDQINVALDDLGEGATLTLSKITGLFGIEAEYGTEQALLKTGSVINDLSQNCSAGAGYIAEFTSRMAATGKTANMTIPQIMAYAAVMDDSSVNVEQSSTALSKLIIHLMQEPAKYAKAAGLELKDWYATMQKDANEGLLQFVEGLKKKGGLDQLAPLFKDMGENGIGAMNAIGLLADRLDLVRRQQDAANESFKLGTSITNEFEVANNTVAARLEKNKNALHETAVEIGQQLLPVYNLFTESTLAASRALSWLIKYLMENKTVIIAGAVAYGVYTAAVNAAAIKTAALTAWEKACTVAKTAGRVVTLACSAAYNTLTGNVTRATAATKLLSTTSQTAIGVFGAVVAVIGLAVGALIQWRQRTQEQTAAQKALAAANETATARMADQKAKIEQLISVAKDENVAMETRIDAVNRLNKIIPNYNAQIDATTKKYQASTTALNQYLNALEKKIRYEANQEELTKLIREEERLKRIKEAADKEADKERAANQQSKGVYVSSEASNFAAAPEIVRNEKQRAANAAADNLQKAQDSTAQMRNYIQQGLKSGTMTATLESSAADTTLAPTVPSYGDVPKSKSEIAKEKAEAAKAAREAAAAQRRAEKKAKEDFKKGLEEIDKIRAQEDAVSIGLYKTGQLTLSEYQTRLHDSEEKMFDAKIEYYKQAGLEEDEDVAQFEKKKEESDLKYKEKKTKADAAQIKREQEMAETQAQIDYVTPGNEIFQNEEKLQERLFRLKVYYLYRTQALYAEGSEEYLRIQEEITDTEQAESLRKQKETADLIMKYSLEYKKQDIDAREKMELSALDALHEAGKLSEIEYQKALKEIRDKFRKEREEAEKDPSNPKKTTKDYSASSEWGDLIKNMNDALTMQLDSSQSKLVAWSQKVSAIAQAAFAAVSAVGTQVSALMSAQVELDTKRIEKEYDARIKAAGKNSKKVKQLEEEKEAAIQKMKAKANKANMAIQIATAIAQTAANAISAYGSVVGIPVVGPTLAPIAAALAVAAGMVQVATIRKQAQAAELSGYSEGGYTKSGNKDEPAGIVHAGEWVAPARMVKDPRTAPMIHLLEQARRTNVFPSITPADVSADVAAQRLTARDTRRSPAAISDRFDQSVSRLADSYAAANSPSKSDKALTEALSRLNDALETGITANVSMTGRNGLEENRRRYNQLMKNSKIR